MKWFRNWKFTYWITNTGTFYILHQIYSGFGYRILLQYVGKRFLYVHRTGLYFQKMELNFVISVDFERTSSMYGADAFCSFKF